VEHFYNTNLVITAASVFEISCGKKDRHTEKWRSLPVIAVGVGKYNNPVKWRSVKL